MTWLNVDESAVQLQSSLNSTCASFWTRLSMGHLHTQCQYSYPIAAAAHRPPMPGPSSRRRYSPPLLVLTGLKCGWRHSCVLVFKAAEASKRTNGISLCASGLEYALCLPLITFTLCTCRTHGKLLLGVLGNNCAYPRCTIGPDATTLHEE